jgi:hypothetical protein
LGLPIPTASYRILRKLTAYYRLGGRLPFVERQTNGKRTVNERLSAREWGHFLEVENELGQKEISNGGWASIAD